MADKDFKILLPGYCNASCKFCFWKNKSCNVNWLNILDESLYNATFEFSSLNISGGEPTISPYLSGALDIISKYRNKFTKVVLTTNGSNLGVTLASMEGVVDHLNISRHHYSDDYNRMIFKSSDVPDTVSLQLSCYRANTIGIDVTLNVMVDNSWRLFDLARFIDLTKLVGASYLTFRHDYNDGLCESKFEKLANIKTVYTHSCGVCRTNVKLIQGIYVSYKYGVIEPSDTINDFEVILGQDGKLSYDYEGNKPFKF